MQEVIPVQHRELEMIPLIYLVVSSVALRLMEAYTAL